MAQLTAIKASDLPIDNDTTGGVVIQAKGDNLSRADLNPKFEELEGKIDGAVSGFKGAITISDTKTEDGYYIPTESGTYTNAGGLVYDPEGVDKGYKVTFIKSGAEWFKDRQNVGLIISSTLDKTKDLEVPSSKAVADFVSDRIRYDEIGIETVYPKGTDFLEGISDKSYDDGEFWGKGYFNDLGDVIIQSSDDYLYTKKFHPLPLGEYDTDLYLINNTSIVVYNFDKTIQTIYQNKGDRRGDITWKLTQSDYKGGFIRLTSTLVYDDIPGTKKLNERKLALMEDVLSFENSIFITKNTKTDFTEEVLIEKFGVKPVLEGKEFLIELIGTDIDDRSVWLTGYYNELGKVVNEPLWYRPTERIKIYPGKYSFTLFFRGNAKCLVTNLSGNITQVLSNSLDLDRTTQTLSIIEPSYLLISHREDKNEEGMYFGRTALLTLTNPEKLFSPLATLEQVQSIESFDLRKLYKDTHAPRKKRKIATFIADDGANTDMTWFIPILDEFKIKATFAIAPFWVDAVYRLTREQIIQIHKDGHDIASHTRNHLYMDTLTPEELEEEILYSKLFLESMLSAPVDMFVSPFGIRSPYIDSMVAKYHKANFITGYSVNNPIPLDSFFINRISFDLVQNDTAGFDIVKDKIDQSMSNGDQWAVFAIHTLYSEYKTTNTVDRRQELRDIISYLIDQGYTIMTARDAYNYYKNPVEINLKRVDATYYKLGMDGSEENVNYF